MIFFNWIGTRDGWTSERVNALINGDLHKLKNGKFHSISDMNANLFDSLYMITNPYELQFVYNFNGKGGPLFLACAAGNPVIVEYLLENQANILIKNKHGWYPIHFACKYGNLEIVKILVKNSSPINVKTNKGETPIDLAKFYNKEDIVEYLISFKN